MKLIKVGKSEFSVVESLAEMLFSQYIDYIEWCSEVVSDNDPIKDSLKSLRLVEILASLPKGTLKKRPTSELTQIGIAFGEIYSKIDNTINLADHMDKSFEIDGTTYLTRTLKSMDELTLAEIAKIDAIEKYEKDKKMVYAKKVAVLVRPGNVSIDEETKQEVYNIEEFDDDDVANLDYRANLFYTKGKAVNMIPVLFFFQNMNPETEEIIQSYTKLEKIKE